MALYVIGDVQGCLVPLQKLLDQIRFDPGHDRLWFVGDLVNRGPDSLGVLRSVRALGDAALVVLGNHDLHLLAVAAGVATPGRRDTLDNVLMAPDRTDLCDWLRQQPLLHYDAALNTCAVHAGLLPQWDIVQACQLAREAEAALRGPQYASFLRDMYGDRPNQWHDTLEGIARLRVVVNALTRLRYCDIHGAMAFRDKGPPGSQAAGLLPWFEVPRRTSETRVVFGHWSTLGVGRHAGNTIALDSGCVWGQRMTAVRLPDEELIAVACGA